MYFLLLKFEQFTVYIEKLSNIVCDLVCNDNMWIFRRLSETGSVVMIPERLVTLFIHYTVFFVKGFVVKYTTKVPRMHKATLFFLKTFWHCIWAQFICHCGPQISN